MATAVTNGMGSTILEVATQYIEQEVKEYIKI